MNKAVLLILTGMVALLTESCSYMSDFADARKEIEENTAKPIPVKVNASDTPATETEVELEEFADLEEEAEPVQAIAGLIPATNPDVRVRNSVRGRQDPFSVVTLTPRIEIEQEEVKQEARQQNRSNPVNRTQNNNTNTQLPEIPGVAEVVQPTLAENVIITGVYQSNGTAKLIVQAPEEETSRYVEVGQYLSNGQVLVKSIDMNHFPTPLVILEQSGIEVAKAVGETPVDSEENTISSLPLENSSNKTLVSNISLNLK